MTFSVALAKSMAGFALAGLAGDNETGLTALDRAIDVHIHNMREKLETDPKNPEYLLTVRGMGYRLRDA